MFPAREIPGSRQCAKHDVDRAVAAGRGPGGGSRRAGPTVSCNVSTAIHTVASCLVPHEVCITGARSFRPIAGDAVSSSQDDESPTRDIVVIGASAGGVEAITALLRQMP